MGNTEINLPAIVIRTIVAVVVAIILTRLGCKDIIAQFLGGSVGEVVSSIIDDPKHGSRDESAKNRVWQAEMETQKQQIQQQQVFIEEQRRQLAESQRLAEERESQRAESQRLERLAEERESQRAESQRLERLAEERER
jgi:membrane protein involved in colicin uptake